MDKDLFELMAMTAILHTSMTLGETDHTEIIRDDMDGPWNTVRTKENGNELIQTSRDFSAKLYELQTKYIKTEIPEISKEFFEYMALTAALRLAQITSTVEIRDQIRDKMDKIVEVLDHRGDYDVEKIVGKFSARIKELILEFNLNIRNPE